MPYGNQTLPLTMQISKHLSLGSAKFIHNGTINAPLWASVSHLDVGRYVALWYPVILPTTQISFSVLSRCSLHCLSIQSIRERKDVQDRTRPTHDRHARSIRASTRRLGFAQVWRPNQCPFSLSYLLALAPLPLALLESAGTKRHGRWPSFHSRR
jgi:hypothetical protein